MEKEMEKATRDLFEQMKRGGATAYYLERLLTEAGRECSLLSLEESVRIYPDWNIIVITWLNPNWEDTGGQETEWVTVAPIEVE